jgi:2-dehydropantoate 2-reductase
MKIAVVGCGAVGSYYGARLGRAGQDVHFLLRSDYEIVRRRGVHVHSVDGDFRAAPHCARTPQDIGEADLVLVALKTTANHRFADLILPLAGPRTALVTLQNGLGNEAQLAALLGPEPVLGALCFVCLNRVRPGEIHHLAYGQIVLGEYQRPPGPRTRDLLAILRHANIRCEITDDLERARWEKLVWNVPFNGLGVAGAAGYAAVCSGEIPVSWTPAPCLTTDVLLAEPRWETLVRELMAEVIATARALGYPVAPELAEVNLARTRTMGPYAASTLVDYQRRLPLELEAMFLEPLRRARQAQVPTPRLAALCRLLERLDPAPPRTDR